MGQAFVIVLHLCVKRGNIFFFKKIEMFNIYLKCLIFMSRIYLYKYNPMCFTTLCGGLFQTAPRSSQFYEKVQYDILVPPDQNKW